MTEIWYLVIVWYGVVVPMNSFQACIEEAAHRSHVMNTTVSCISPRQSEPSMSFTDGVLEPVPKVK